MKKMYYCFMALLFVLQTIVAQDQNNHWQFGVADVNFSTDPPTINNSGVSNQYSTASISDDNGNLLFYTDGGVIWNKNHAQMTYLNSSPAVHYPDDLNLQAAVIVPHPGTNKFYVFSALTEHIGASNFMYYRYYLVDFTNPSYPLGVVTFSNNSWITTNPYNYGPLTVVKNATEDGYFVVIHQPAPGNVNSSGIFRCFPVTSAGLNLTPIESSFPININFPSQYNNSSGFSTTSGLIKFTPNNLKLGVLIQNNISPLDNYSFSNNFFTLNFNNSTGVFSNFISVENDFYGVFAKRQFEFSSDSQKVYFSNRVLYVKDLTNLTIPIRGVSSTNGIGISTLGRMQRDKNNNILITSSGSLNKIENENSFLTSTLTPNYLPIPIITNFYQEKSLPQLIPTFPPCPSVLVITAEVATGIDNKQASVSIQASNTINNLAGAIYHAPKVSLTPNFNAKAGSNVHIYPEGCTNTFLAKQTQLDSNIVSEEKEIKIKKGIVKISPNPNNGIFKINFNDFSAGMISITDLYGFTVLKSTFKDQNEFELNLQNNPKGIYVVKVFIDDKVYSEKIVVK